MFFPLFLDLSEKEILVAGAGKIACRRIRTLCGYAGHITVVAPRVCEELSLDGNLTVVQRRFQESDLDEKDMVLAATDDDELNHRIASLCHRRGIPVNVCSDAKACDFQFPSVVETQGIVVGINASGENHHLVKETRKQVEALFEEADFQSRYVS